MSRILVNENPIITPGPGVRGFYKFEAVGFDADGKERYRRTVADWFPNLITNAGLNAIGTMNGLMTYGGASVGAGFITGVCKVGSGTTAPTVLDSGLQNYIGNGVALDRSESIISSGSPLYYLAASVVYRFSTGVAAGNLSEVGIGDSYGNVGLLFSRALILDASGNPTTITILSTETLDVTYELRIYPPLVDGSGSVIISGVTYPYTKRALRMDTGNTTMFAASMNLGGDFSDTNVLGPITGNLGGQSAGAGGNGSITMQPYSNNSLVRDCTYSFGLTQGNRTGGIGSLAISGPLGGIQFAFSTKIPKDATKVMSINMRYGPWGRYP